MADKRRRIFEQDTSGFAFREIFTPLREEGPLRPRPSGKGGGPQRPATPAHSSQALAYLARTVGGNEGGNSANIFTLIDGLVADGVWAKLDCLYVFAQQNVTDAKLNLVGTSYPITISGTLGADQRIISFVPYVGFSSFANGFLNTGFNPSIAPSPKYTRDSASFGIWPYALVTGTVPVMSNGVGNSCSIYDFYSGNLFYARVNNSTIGSVPLTIAKGLFAGDRINASSVYPYQNGVASAVQTAASVALDNANFSVGEYNPSETYSAAFIGASLGATLQLALYNRLRTYLTAVGVP